MNGVCTNVWVQKPTWWGTGEEEEGVKQHESCGRREVSPAPRVPGSAAPFYSPVLWLLVL